MNNNNLNSDNLNNNPAKKNNNNYLKPIFLFIIIFVVFSIFIFNFFKSSTSSLLQENKISYAIANTFYEVYTDAKDIYSDVEVLSLFKDITKSQYNIYSPQSYITPEFNIVTDIPNQQILIDFEFAEISISNSAIIISNLLSKPYGFSIDTIVDDLKINLPENSQVNLFDFFNTNLDMLNDFNLLLVKNMPAILNCFEYVEALPTRVTLANGTHDLATYSIVPNYENLEEVLINLNKDIFELKSIQDYLSSNLILTNSIVNFFKGISGVDLFLNLDSFDFLDIFTSLSKSYSSTENILIDLEQDLDNYIKSEISKFKRNNNKYSISLFNQKVVRLSKLTSDNLETIVKFNNLDNLLELITFTIIDNQNNLTEEVNCSLTLEDDILYLNILDDFVLEYKMLETKNNLLINYNQLSFPFSISINSKENIVLSLGSQECIIKKSNLDKSWFKEQEYTNVFEMSSFDIYMLAFELLLSLPK